MEQQVIRFVMGETADTRRVVVYHSGTTTWGGCYRRHRETPARTFDYLMAKTCFKMNERHWTPKSYTCPGVSSSGTHLVYLPWGLPFSCSHVGTTQPPIESVSDATVFVGKFCHLIRVDKLTNARHQRDLLEERSKVRIPSTKCCHLLSGVMPPSIRKWWAYIPTGTTTKSGKHIWIPG